MTQSDPLVTAIEAALDQTVAWRKPAYLSDTVQSLVAAGEYRKAAEVMAPRIRSLVNVWKANPEPPCVQCGGGKGLGHTPDCPAVAGDRDLNRRDDRIDAGLGTGYVGEFDRPRRSTP